MQNKIARTCMVAVLSWSISSLSFAGELQGGFSVTYAGGSLPNVKPGDDLKLYFEGNRVLLKHKENTILTIPPRSITDVSYGEDVHHRIGTGAAVAVVSLGIGAMVAFSKSTKHFIEITWVDGDTNGGLALQSDKNEYRGLLAALESVRAKGPVKTDLPNAGVQSSSGTPSAQASTTFKSVGGGEDAKGAAVRFTSTPANAEVEIDGAYWGSTPTATLTRLPEGTHTVIVKRLGYEIWEQKITVAPGDDRTINAELKAKPNDPAKPHIVGLD